MSRSRLGSAEYPSAKHPGSHLAFGQTNVNGGIHSQQQLHPDHHQHHNSNEHGHAHHHHHHHSHGHEQGSVLDFEASHFHLPVSSSMNMAAKRGSKLSTGSQEMRTNYKVLPGNAGARMSWSETQGGVPTSFRAGPVVLSEHTSAPAPPASSYILNYGDEMNETLLQIDIERQQQHLNRLAQMRRKLMAKASTRSGGELELATGRGSIGRSARGSNGSESDLLSDGAGSSSSFTDAVDNPERKSKKSNKSSHSLDAEEIEISTAMIRRSSLKGGFRFRSCRPTNKEEDKISTSSVSSIYRHSNPAWASSTLCNLYVDDIPPSPVVYLTVQMDTSELSFEEKQYLPLFCEAILESPYVDNSQTFFDSEALMEGLQRDVLKYETFVGIREVENDDATDKRFFCGSYPHLFCIWFAVEYQKLREAFGWMQILLWRTRWDPVQLKKIAERLASRAREGLKDASTMTKAMMVENLYHLNSNPRCMSLVRQQLFLGKDIQTFSGRKIVSMLESIRMVVLRPENATVQVAGSLAQMEFYLTDRPEVMDAIPHLLKDTFDYVGWHWGYPTKRLASQPDSSWMKSVSCIRHCLTENIFRLQEGSSYSALLQTAPSIDSYHDPHYPLLLVTIAYFTQPDEQFGPFYRTIEEPGHASHYAIILKPEEGMIYFELGGAQDLVAAYTNMYHLMVEHCKEMERDDEELGETFRKGHNKDKKPSDESEEAGEDYTCPCGPNCECDPTDCENEGDHENEGEPQKEDTTEVQQQHTNVIETQTETFVDDSESLDNPNPSSPSDIPTWSQDILDKAKEYAAFLLIKKEKNPQSLALTALLQRYREQTPGFTRRILGQISAVTMKDVKLMTKKYLRPLFISTTTCAVAAPPDQLHTISVELMDSCGKRLAPLPPIHQSEMAKFI